MGATKAGDAMNAGSSRKQLSSRLRRQYSGAGLLDALHDSRRCRALREVDNCRHLLDDAEAAEIRRAIEDLTQERVSIRSFWRVCQPQCAWISLMMRRARARAFDYWPRKIPRRRGGTEGPRGATNMNNLPSFHRGSWRGSAKPDPAAPGRQCSTSGQLSVLTTIVIITVLVGFAVLHVIGATLIATLSDRPAAAPAMFQGD